MTLNLSIDEPSTSIITIYIIVATSTSFLSFLVFSLPKLSPCNHQDPSPHPFFCNSQERKETLGRRIKNLEVRERCSLLLKNIYLSVSLTY